MCSNESLYQKLQVLIGVVQVREEDYRAYMASASEDDEEDEDDGESRNRLKMLLGGEEEEDLEASHME